MNRLSNGGGEVQEYRVAGLHIGGAAAVDVVGVAGGRNVVGDRDGVEMSGQDHPTRAAEFGPGQHRLSVANHAVAGLRTQCGLHLVGDPLLVTRHTGDVHQRGGQLDRVSAQVQHNSSG